MNAKPGDLTSAHGGDQRFMTEFLPRMDVGKMDFNGWNTHR